MTITPVLLCGGSGTRLWPLSRKSYPKQFTHIGGDKSLLAASAIRLSNPAFTAPLVVTGVDFRFIVTEHLAEAGIAGATVLVEPTPRNTAPAVLAAAIWLARDDPEQLMLIAPSDHLIPNHAAFQEVILQGVPDAEAGRIVTYGILPDRPETGFGYLEIDTSAEGNSVPLKSFVEKPDVTRAAEMVSSGKFLWNAGIFLFTARTILSAFEAHAPALLAPVQQAVEEAEPDLNFFRLAEEPWSQVETISIDYAVMERSDNLSVVPFAETWSDLGDWDAVWREGPCDKNWTVEAGPVTAIDCRDCLIRSESQNLEVVGIGLENTFVVATSDAVLVADKSRSQDVPLAVNALKAKGAKQATEFPRDHRPWGWFETLALEERFQVKRIVVKPGASLSLQSHHHRSEHWVVVSGTAEIEVDDETKLITENQSVYIPVGAIHRLRNSGKVSVVLIEVQTGSYLGEDDIIRYEDEYARGKSTKKQS